MSDSGRQIGDCEHGETRRLCRICLTARAELAEATLVTRTQERDAWQEASNSAHEHLNTARLERDQIELRLASLTADLAQALAEQERLRGALMMYGGHAQTCDYNPKAFSIHRGKCNCGIALALSPSQEPR